jgi:hypothetical protein
MYIFEIDVNFLKNENEERCMNKNRQRPLIHFLCIRYLSNRQKYFDKIVGYM